MGANGSESLNSQNDVLKSPESALDSKINDVKSMIDGMDKTELSRQLNSGEFVKKIVDMTGKGINEVAKKIVDKDPNSMSKAEIKLVQIAGKVDNPSIKVDGIMGPQTMTIISDIISKKDLLQTKVDGVVNLDALEANDAISAIGKGPLLYTFNRGFNNFVAVNQGKYYINDLGINSAKDFFNEPSISDDLKNECYENIKNMSMVVAFIDPSTGKIGGELNLRSITRHQNFPKDWETARLIMNG